MHNTFNHYFNWNVLSEGLNCAKRSNSGNSNHNNNNSNKQLKKTDAIMDHVLRPIDSNNIHKSIIKYKHKKLIK